MADFWEISSTVAAAFNFNIDKRPLVALKDGWNAENGLAQQALQTGHFGLFRSDTNECVGNTVKENYVQHQSEDVIAATEAAATAFDGEVEVLCHFKNAHLVHVRPTREHRVEIYGKVDNIFPVMGIRGGLDGRGFQAWLGFGRDMCRNMAELKSVAETRISIHHNLNLRHHMDDLISQFQGLKMNWKTVVSKVNVMESNTFDIDWFLGNLYPEPAEDAKKGKVTSHENRLRDIKRRLSNEMFKSGRSTSHVSWNHNDQIRGEVSAWMLYNAVQGYVQHDGRGAGSRTEFQGMIKSNGSGIVGKAERLALGA